MESVFRYFSVEHVEMSYFEIELSPYLETIRTEGDCDLAEVISDAKQLGTEFLSIFLGIFFGDSRFLSWQREERLLPWCNSQSEDIGQKIQQIAQSHSSDAFNSDAWWEFVNDPNGDCQRQLEELAVAGLRELDGLSARVEF